MDLAWIIFGLLGWGIALFLVLVLMKMAGDQDHAARRAETDIQLKVHRYAHGGRARDGERFRDSRDGPEPG